MVMRHVGLLDGVFWMRRRIRGGIHRMGLGGGGMCCLELDRSLVMIHRLALCWMLCIVI